MSHSHVDQQKDFDNCPRNNQTELTRIDYLMEVHAPKSQLRNLMGRSHGMPAYPRLLLRSELQLASPYVKDTRRMTWSRRFLFPKTYREVRFNFYSF